MLNHRTIPVWYYCVVSSHHASRAVALSHYMVVWIVWSIRETNRRIDSTYLLFHRTYASIHLTDRPMQLLPLYSSATSHIKPLRHQSGSSNQIDSSHWFTLYATWTRHIDSPHIVFLSVFLWFIPFLFIFHFSFFFSFLPFFFSFPFSFSFLIFFLFLFLYIFSFLCLMIFSFHFWIIFLIFLSRSGLGCFLSHSRTELWWLMCSYIFCFVLIRIVVFSE